MKRKMEDFSFNSRMEMIEDENSVYEKFIQGNDEIKSDDSYDENHLYFINNNYIYPIEEMNKIINPIHANESHNINKNFFVIYKAFNVFTPAKKNKENFKEDTKVIFKIVNDKKQRKYKPDNIRKKIKIKFFKALRHCINNKLKEENKNLKLEYLPQNFVSNATKKVNKPMLNKTLEEIIIENKVNNSEKEETKNKYHKNLNLLAYLKQLDNLNKKEIKDIYKIFNISIKDLFNEYLKSNEFKDHINEIKTKEKNEEYVKMYTNHAGKFVEYYSK